MSGEVNLKHMLQMAESISGRGYQISERFKKLLFHVKSMQEYWKGKAYRIFVQNVNQQIETFEEISIYYAEKLPKEIALKRNIYAKARNELEEEVKFCFAVGIEKVIIKEQGDRIKYCVSAMDIKIERVIDVFDDIKILLNAIEDDFCSIVWESTDGILIKQEFKGKILEVRKKIQWIKKSFYDELTTRNESHDKSGRGKFI